MITRAVYRGPVRDVGEPSNDEVYWPRFPKLRDRLARWESLGYVLAVAGIRRRVTAASLARTGPLNW